MQTFRGMTLKYIQEHTPHYKPETKGMASSSTEQNHFEVKSGELYKDGFDTRIAMDRPSRVLTYLMVAAVALGGYFLYDRYFKNRRE